MESEGRMERENREIEREGVNRGMAGEGGRKLAIIGEIIIIDGMHAEQNFNLGVKWGACIATCRSTCYTVGRVLLSVSCKHNDIIMASYFIIL